MADKKMSKAEIQTVAFQHLSSFGCKWPSEEEAENFIDNLTFDCYQHQPAEDLSEEEYQNWFDNLTISEEPISEELKDILRANVLEHIQEPAKTGKLTAAELDAVHWGTEPE